MDKDRERWEGGGVKARDERAARRATCRSAMAKAPRPGVPVLNVVSAVCG